MKIKTIWLVCALLLLTRCNYTVNKKSAGGAPTPPSKLQDRGTIDYKTVNAVVFKNCVGCHGAAGGVTLSSYADVIQNLEMATNDIDSGRMPLGGQLSPEAKAVLHDWVNHGAPETIEGLRTEENGVSQ